MKTLKLTEEYMEKRVSRFLNLEPGYENLKTADDRVLLYEDNTFFSVLDDPYNMRRSVRGGRKNKSKKNKSNKYKSKKNKSKKYK